MTAPELTTAERATLLAALRVYRVNRAAQGKLDSQALLRRDRQEANKVAARYERLIAIIDSVALKLKIGTPQ